MCVRQRYSPQRDREIETVVRMFSKGPLHQGQGACINVGPQIPLGI